MSLPASLSLASDLADLSATDLDVVHARMAWLHKARQKQLTPIDRKWYAWLIMTGRGWGKTETGANWLWWEAWCKPSTRCAVVAATSEDLRKTCFEGVTGLLNVIPRSIIADYNRSTHEIYFKNGSVIQSFSAQEPDRLRGPQYHKAWCDEIAAWDHLEDTMMNLRMGLRLGTNPQVVMTTTPKPREFLRTLSKRLTTVLTTGATSENLSNLPEAFAEELYDIYQNTRLGLQELEGVLLDDAEGALWKREWFDKGRRPLPELSELIQIVVAIDPAATSTESSDETGIVVSAVDKMGHGWALEDLSGKYTPEKWARAAIDAYHRWSANKIIAESNNGGDMVKSVVRAVDPTVPIRLVTASRGKAARAEPIAAFYEQGRVHHVGVLRQLEDQCCIWEPMGKMRSPDRLDALVWGLSEMMVNRRYGQAPPGQAVLGGRGEDHYDAA